MPKPVPPHSDDEFDATEPESVEFLLSDHLKDGDDISIHSQVSTDSMKPKSKITDYHFDSGVIPPSAMGTPIPSSGADSDGAPFSPGFAGRDSGGEPDTDPDAENSEESHEEIPSIEGYVILRELGRGGMGVVYKAKQMNLERIVALKMILHHGYLTKETLTRFRTEADALARVAHPGIVQVYEISEHDGQAYFTLEYCGGGSLAREIKKGPFQPRKAAEVVEQLARAIHFAHEANIIHRDLKPGNILRTTLGQYKITDFGLAKKLDVEENITQSGAIIGTPGYMSPEQASGDVNRLGPPCDIYALGVILYECVTGRVPFRAQNVMDAVIQVVTLEPVAPSRLEPKTPKDLETIILKCLHKTPERRYRTAADLAEDLGRFLRGEPILGRPASFSERSWKWIRKHPASTAAMAMSVFGLVGYLGLTVWQNQELEFQVNAAVKREAETQEELQAKRNLERKKNEALAALSEARNAERDSQWDVMIAATNRVIAQGDSEGLVAELEEAKFLHDKAELELNLAANLKASELLYREFNATRDRVRILASPFTKLDPQTQADQIAQECRKGLKMFGLDPDAEPKLKVTEVFSEDQRLQIREGCYELFLLLADSTAMPHPGDSSEEIVARALRAIPILKRASILQPQDASWVGRAAHYAKQAKDPLEAERIRFEGEQRAPKSAFDHFLMGENFYLLGQWKEAKESLGTALRIEPKHFWSQYLLGTISFRSTPPSYIEAKTYMNFCISQREDFSPLYLTRGLSNAGLGEYAHAEEDFEKALALDPSELMRYNILLNRAKLRQGRQNFDGAMADLQAALAIRPDEGILQEMIAQTEWYRKKPTEAIAAIDRAIELQPKEGSFYATRATFREATRNSVGALEDLSKAISLLTPNNPVGMSLRIKQAKWLLKERKFEQVIEVCDGALKLADQSNEKKVEALTTKAEALGETKQYPEVLETLEAASKLGWKPTATSLRYRGLAYARTSKLTEAIADLSAALEKEPTAQTYADRGWVFVRSGSVKLGLIDFDQSLALARSAEAFSGRGFARVWMGDIKAGIDDASEAVRTGGESSRILYNCARSYAIAANKLAVQEKTKSTGARMVETRMEYQEKATELLGRALELIPAEQRVAFWRDIGKEDAIRSLSKLPAFVKLDQRYATKTATQP